MGILSRWLDASQAFVTAWASELLEILPDLLGALALLLLGWALAGVARGIIRRLADTLNRFLERISKRSKAGGVSVPGSVVRVVGGFGYWLIIVSFAATAAHIAHLDSVAAWLGQVLSHVPSLIFGGLIVLAGYVVSTFIRDLVTAAMTASGTTQAGAAAVFAQWMTFLAAVVIAFDQIGIDVTFLITIFSILIGGSLIALAIAFGLGARDMISNLLGCQDAKRHYEPGQSVRIAEVEGEILEFTPTSIVLETADGRLNVPARVFHESIITLKVPS